MRARLLAVLAGSGMLAGCVTAPPWPVPPVPPPVPISVTRFSSVVRLEPGDVPPFDDDIDTASLHTAVLQSLAYYQNLPENQLFVLGIDSYTARDLVSSMANLANLLEGSTARKDWISVLRESFVTYQSVGTDPERTVTFSSYYEPTISARLKKSHDFQFPMYARPSDLIDVDLSLFDPVYQGARVSGRREGKALVPYSTRADIDSARALKDKGLEIAWARDPMEVLDLQIEGSGWLNLGNGSLRRIRYDGDNGRHYRSVGQYLISSGRIPAASFNRNVFHKYFSKHPQERQKLLNVNERYVFFRIDTSTTGVYAYGNIEVPLTAGRSIATDPKLFPKGALAWISTNGVRRFVLNQDEGGAIQGPGRVDIFAGHGADAARFATHLWNRGKLYFLVKKKG